MRQSLLKSYSCIRRNHYRHSTLVIRVNYILVSFCHKELDNRSDPELISIGTVTLTSLALDWVYHLRIWPYILNNMPACCIVTVSKFILSMNSAVFFQNDTLILFATHLEQEQLTLWTGSTKSQETVLLGTSSSIFGVAIWLLLREIKYML